MEGGAAGPAWCCECDDTPAAVHCKDCGEDFCRPCWGAQHRRGKRAQHCIVALDKAELEQPLAPERGAGEPATVQISSVDAATGANTIADHEPEPEPEPEPAVGARSAEPSGAAHAAPPEVRALAERCRHIPLRLSGAERELLGFLEGALHVSEYTDVVDVVSRYGIAARIASQMEDFCGLTSGLVVCNSFKKGGKVVAGSFEDNEELFQAAFEAGRRYKIQNPQKLRTNYGKLMHMLQDWATSSAQRNMGFAASRPIVTVYSFLDDADGLDLLASPHLPSATLDTTKLSRAAAAAAVEEKRSCTQAIIAEHSSATLSAEDIQRCLDSIADSNNYLAMNAEPVERMVRHLKENFSPDKPQDGYSLAIGSGLKSSRSSSSFSRYSYGYSSLNRGRSMLTHSHSTQYTFVLQTLTLWREICERMYKLWLMADADLLSTRSSYRLCNTGQGLNRLQSCPNVGAEMSDVLRSVQQRCGSWVGLSVVHLGDRDVPNALVFIDKCESLRPAPARRCRRRCPPSHAPPLARWAQTRRWPGSSRRLRSASTDWMRCGPTRRRGRTSSPSTGAWRRPSWRSCRTSSSMALMATATMAAPASTDG